MFWPQKLVMFAAGILRIQESRAEESVVGQPKCEATNVKLLWAVSFVVRSR